MHNRKRYSKKSKKIHEKIAIGKYGRRLYFYRKRKPSTKSNAIYITYEVEKNSIHGRKPRTELPRIKKMGSRFITLVKIVHLNT